MSKIKDKMLKCMATTAEEAFWEAMGLASCGGTYEPELSDEAKEHKRCHVSKVETLYNRLRGSHAMEVKKVKVYLF